MAEVSTLVGIGELGCAAPLPLPPGPGYAPVSTPDGIVWQVAGAGGPTTVDVSLSAGVLTVSVNGVDATVALAGEPVGDAFGVALGYWLPV